MAVLRTAVRRVGQAAATSEAPGKALAADLLITETLDAMSAERLDAVGVQAD
jgi:hypothetical protein